MARNKTATFSKFKTFNIKNPIQKAKRDGMFEMTTTSVEKYKANLYTLVFTGIGQRPMMPTFGTSIMNLLFEPVDDMIFVTIEEEIKSKAKIWVPEVNIIAVEFEDKENKLENNTISMRIKFNLKQDETIQDFIEIEMGL